MPLPFLIRYALEQFGFIPDTFSPEFIRSAKQAYQTQFEG